MRYFIELSYFGKDYHGWQNQPDAISVQEVIEKMLSRVFPSEVSVVGAGRTDAGVHAKQMFAHFDTESVVDGKELTYKLNSMLPKDVAIHEIFRVTDETHARFDAVSRSYEYHIVQKKNVFQKDFAWWFRREIDVEKMNEAAAVLKKYTNFRCFSRSRTDVRTYNCRIDEAAWKIEDEKLVFHITADRFLRNMVRAIVGTLVEIGEGRMPVSEINRIIESEDRGEAGASVPAHGLYLSRIVYPENIRIQ